MKSSGNFKIFPVEELKVSDALGYHAEILGVVQLVNRGQLGVDLTIIAAVLLGEQDMLFFLTPDASVMLNYADVLYRRSLTSYRSADPEVFPFMIAFVRLDFYSNANLGLCFRLLLKPHRLLYLLFKNWCPRQDLNLHARGKGF